LRSERGVRNNENRGLYRIALDTAGRWLREVG
jgi:hypothetical protein